MMLDTNKLTDEPAVVVNSPTGEPAVVVNSPTGEPAVVVNSPTGEPAVVVNSPTGEPAVVVNSPTGEPAVVVNSPTGEPAVVVNSPTGEPAVVVNSPTGEPAVVVNSPTGEPAVVVNQLGSECGLGLPFSRFISPVSVQDSESELKDGASDSDSKADSGAPEGPISKDDTPEVLNKALSGLSSRWRNWWVRGILTMAMISFFFFIIYMGPIVLMMIVLCVQIKCFQEIITIGYSVYHSYHLPWFRTLSWYFLLCVNYFFYGETVTDYFFSLVQREEPLRILSKYHRFISFTLYLTGFCMFVLSLVKKHYRLQFYMFGWTHVTLLIVVTQSHLIIHNLFEGMIWFIVPISCVICNDIMAYMFGFFFGRTPLIKLSPKKTWEGFIGGFFATVVFGILLSYVMAGYSYFVCPVEFNNDSNRFQVDCEPSELFQLQDYTLPATLESFTGWDFANTIPGHGGIMDRFDCQYLMATFVNVYIASFIRGPNPSKVIQQLMALRLDQQLFIFNSLKTHLTERGLLPALQEAAA
ncbi:hypothetical protein NHX12_028338 [Muraenolepis orangiensis]|uniref:phosphatidate cytidylyltransferase n=1 Tax=Muraenolepis orangiensis TaxID=630683 RepID=A0A9Q0EBZ0_9TELE|nr:hypothetical protein NHX12_028338 [Muraenolepis orangiensis]